jgi:LacI family transcriptional regulator
LGILSELHVQVPTKIAVIGFANTEIANSLNPSLSTIHQPTFEIGEIAVNKLIKLINSKNRDQVEYKDILLESTIKLRKSTLV